MKNLKYAGRFLMRARSYTVINLLGLVFSLSCALIIVRYIHQEWRVDRFCPELERIALMTVVYDDGRQVLGDSRDMNNDPNYRNPLDDPCVELMSRIRLYPDDYVVAGRMRYSVHTLVADSNFLQMFPYPLLEGSLRMEAPDHAIISRRMAQHLFKGRSPIGETLQASCGKSVIIVGVIGEPTTKVSLTFDLILSQELQGDDFWLRVPCELVRLHRAEDLERLNRKNDVPMTQWAYNNQSIRYQLIPLDGFYLNTSIAVDGQMMTHGNPASLRILLGVSVLLLLVGLFNYANLNAVIMLKRSREFALKKVLGAKGREIFAQLYAEHFCLCGAVLLLTWTVVEVTRGLTAHWLEIPVLSDGVFDVSVSLLFWLLVPALVSQLPFVRHYYHLPIRSLRTVGQGGRLGMTRFLFFMLQYIITISLIIAAVYFSRQMDYILHCDLGFRTDDVIQCRLVSDESVYKKYQSDEEWKAASRKEMQTDEYVRRKLDESPYFTHWTSGDLPMDDEAFFDMPCTASTGEDCRMNICFVDQTYMELFGFRLKEGRLWDNTKDQFKQYKMILNETARRMLHIDDIGAVSILPKQRLWYTVDSRDDGVRPYEVVGVVEDFKLGHLSQPVGPVAFCFSDVDRVRNVILSIAPGRRQEAIDYLEKLFHEVNGEGEFTYSFVADRIAARYHDDLRSVRIYTVFAVIAILVSCMGLFGLSLYDIRQRRREIALRKVNGASRRDIFRLLLRKYACIVGAAFVVASGVSYVAIQRYMEGFYHHASLSPWMFLLAGAVVVLTSFCTIAWQINEAMQTNPAEVMKSE
ncbi:MAG: ABC transporter permease [Bacteroides sp.]|nr:ABC transporter permease [Bacteroides sp.]